MAVETDPLSQIHQAIWEILEASNLFTGMVRPENRVKLFGDRKGDPFKEQIREGDLPEVRVIPVSQEINTHATSNSLRVLYRWEIQVSTGEKRLLPVIFPLSWIVLRALYNWSTKMNLLTWGGETFVVRSELTETLFGVTDKDLARGVPGWTAVWSGFTECFFKRSLFATGG